MTYTITQDRSKLIIKAREDERQALREMENIDSDQAMIDVFDWFIRNTALEWINPADTGDLTDAPMLGFLGEVSTKQEGPCGYVCCGRWDDHVRYQPILERWAFMDYQVRSVLQDLRDKGEAVFVS